MRIKNPHDTIINGGGEFEKDYHQMPLTASPRRINFSQELLMASPDSNTPVPISNDELEVTPFNLQKQMNH